MRRARRDPRLHARGDVAGAGAEDGDAGILGELPQPVHRRPAGVAVVEHDRGRRQQAADEEVPHHPAGRREPEDAVARLRVDVQVLVLELLQQDPAVALHDRLRQARRAGAVEDPQRVVERDRREGQRRRVGVGRAERRGAGPGVEGDGVAELRQVGLRVELAQHDGPPQRRQPPLQLGQHRQPVERLAAVLVAVDGEQQGGLDLREAVGDAAGAEVGRGARPDRADRGAGEQRRDRLRHVRDVGDDAVAGADPLCAQGGRHARGQRPQAAPASARRAAAARSRGGSRRRRRRGRGRRARRS